MRERVSQLRSSILAIAGEVMLENKEQIVGLVINQQQEQHVDSSNTPLRPYSRQYMLYKESIGKSGQTDFDLTGEMHAEMNLTVDGDYYNIDSPAITTNGELKTAWLKNWNGSDVMELTPENKIEAWNIIKDSFMEKVNEVLVLD
jgi:hypothetical protein